MFTTNRTLAASPVAGTVNKGMVTLRGNVATQHEREKVHAAVASLPGMDQLDDQIIVQNPAVSWKGESRDY
jgi:osmotically-inducible protein OsmY